MRNTVKNYEKLSEQYNKMLEERNSLIDDLSWYKAKVSRLEENNDKLNELFNYQENKKKEYREVIEKLECKNRDYKVANRNLADYDHEWKNEYVKLENKTKTYKSLLSEFSQHIGNKPSSSTYKYFRAKLDGLGIVEHE
ncbi:hypothetical protein QI270_11115 [Staphylococcus saprophyticus]|nr:hypothetical protein [Staphylococcus saprophyticus]